MAALALLSAPAWAQPLSNVTPRGQVRSSRVKKSSLRKAVHSYLSNRKQITISVIDAPGFGHQAANVSMMQRLTELGFAGRFDIRVPDAQTARKVASLLPTYLADRATIQENRSFSFAGPADGEEPLLVMSGASDTRRPSLTGKGTLLQLQPESWGQQFLHVNGHVQPLAVASGYMFKVPRQNSRQIKRLLRRELGGADNRPKQATVSATLEFASAARGEFLPVYGVGFHGVDKVLAVASALSLLAEDGLTEKPILVPILSNLNENERERIVRGLPKRVRWLEEANVNELANASSGQVYLVPVGSVPKAVFEQYFVNATLAPLVAGKNSTDLARLLGIPHLNTFSERLPKSLLEHPQIGKAQAVLQNPLGKKEVRDLADFFLASRQPGPLRQAFEAMSAWKHGEAADQVLQAVYQVANKQR